MNIETNFGTVAISDSWKCEGDIYADCDLKKMPPVLQKHIGEIIAAGKQQAFEERKAKHKLELYQTLAELEADHPVEVEKPYLGIHLDTGKESLEAGLYINIYSNDENQLEFHHYEELRVTPEVLVNLLLNKIKETFLL